MYILRLLIVFTLPLLALATPNSTPCTPLAQGFDLIDDSPAINSAIVTCGNGGTIVLPQDQIYSIRSPIDFTPCKHCDFQLEGTLLLTDYSGQSAYWGTQRSVLNISSVTGATIRSLTGKGKIDGNAVTYYSRSRWDTGVNAAPHLIHITNNSQQIRVERLNLWNPPMRFFRTEGNASSLSFSSLDLKAQNYPAATVAFSATVSEGEIFGFEMGDVRNVTISDISMSFTDSLNSLGNYGACVAFDSGTDGVVVKNVTCTGAWLGAAVMIGTMASGPGLQGYNFGIPQLTGHDVTNVFVSNLTFQGTNTIETLFSTRSGGYAAGWKNFITTDAISNVTWDGVNVINGSAVVGDRCYLRCNCDSTWDIQVCPNDWKEPFYNVRFKNFRGKVGTQPGNGWGCAGNQTSCDVTFERWNATAASV